MDVVKVNRWVSSYQHLQHRRDVQVDPTLPRCGTDCIQVE